MVLVQHIGQHILSYIRYFEIVRTMLIFARIIFRVIAKGEHDRNKFEYVSFNSKAKQLRMLKSRQPLPNLPFIILGQKFKYSNRTFSV